MRLFFYFFLSNIYIHFFLSLWDILFLEQYNHICHKTSKGGLSMSTLLTKQELEMQLDDFRHILSDFDYSSIKNITFLNIDAFLCYMENIEGNPFKEQYDALQHKLDILQPYLPFISSERANEFLEALSHTSGDQEVTEVKKHFTQLLREDFIKFSRTVTTASQWEHVLQTCEEIRLRKEEMLLALQ